VLTLGVPATIAAAASLCGDTVCTGVAASRRLEIVLAFAQRARLKLLDFHIGVCETATIMGEFNERIISATDSFVALTFTFV
jgi:hypothetical protein